MDKNYEIRERQISFRELWWRFLQSWRFVLICVLLLAVLLTADRYRKDAEYLQNTDRESEISAEDAFNSLSEEEKEEIKTVSEMKERLDQCETYYTESALMNIDPYHVNTVSLQYYADSDYHMNLTQDIDKDVTYDIATAYYSYILNLGINGNGDNTEQYFSELVSADLKRETGVFTISVKGRSMEEADQLAEQIQTEIEAYHAVLSDKIAVHELVLLSKNSSVIIDGDLSARQKDVREMIAALKSELNEKSASLTGSQLAVINQVQEETDGKDIQTGGQTSLGINVKYAVFGGCIGLFLALLGIMLQYILGKCIKYTDEISDIYGLPVIGEIKEENPKKRAFKAVDLWLEKKKKHGSWSQEEQWKMMTANLTVSCKKRELKHIFVMTGRHPNENDVTLADRLIKELREKDIIAEFGGNAIRSAETFEKMSESEGVVLIEKINESLYSDIEKEILQCGEQNQNILGVIVIE